MREALDQRPSLRAHINGVHGHFILPRHPRAFILRDMVGQCLHFVAKIRADRGINQQIILAQIMRRAA